jgi:pimeloyl-ACP methyl ester carboxylesterase
MSQASLAAWKAAGDRFAHRGHDIFWRSGGPEAAPLLLLIHGFPTASWDWEALWPQLAGRYRLLALDMIGFGFSAKPTDYHYSILDQADLHEALLRSRGVGEYHVLAHDYGDTVAQELLARQREPGERPALRSVCFLNGGLFPETHRPVLAQKLLLSPLGPWVARFSRKPTFARNMRAIFGRATAPGPELIDAFWHLLTYHDGLAVMPKLIGYMPERRRHRERWVGALQRSPVPLKLIDGGADPISGAHMAERYRELVPAADVTLLPVIGHYPQVEAPAQVLEAYFAFRESLA